MSKLILRHIAVDRIEHIRPVKSIKNSSAIQYITRFFSRRISMNDEISTRVSGTFETELGVVNFSRDIPVPDRVYDDLIWPLIKVSRPSAPGIMGGYQAIFSRRVELITELIIKWCKITYPSKARDSKARADTSVAHE